VIYDITNKKSFANAESFIKTALKNSKESTIVLLGNKLDCELKKRNIPRVKGEELAKKYSIYFEEISCFNGKNVEESFMKFVELVFQKRGLLSSIKPKELTLKKDSDGSCKLM
jgi:GTPase SAR1 family protein